MPGSNELDVQWWSCLWPFYMLRSFSPKTLDTNEASRWEPVLILNTLSRMSLPVDLVKITEVEANVVLRLKMFNVVSWFNGSQELLHLGTLGINFVIKLSEYPLFWGALLNSSNFCYRSFSKITFDTKDANYRTRSAKMGLLAWACWLSTRKKCRFFGFLVEWCIRKRKWIFHFHFTGKTMKGCRNWRHEVNFSDFI